MLLGWNWRGGTKTMKKATSDLARFRSHVQKSGECWEWSARLDKYGYGVFKCEGKNHKAHRWIYEKLNFTLEPDMVIDHLCRNRK